MDQRRVIKSLVRRGRLIAPNATAEANLRVGNDRAASTDFQAGE
jgi:hypothetical protein